MASDQEIKVCADVKPHNNPGSDISIKVDPRNVYTISASDLKEMKVQGLFMNNNRIIAAFETADNQLDFNHLVVNTKALSKKDGRF